MIKFEKTAWLLWVSALSIASAFCVDAAPVRTHAFKRPAKMEMLRPGEVKPQGWLRDWCVTARNGYISRMDEIDQAFPRAWNRDFHPRGKYLDWGDPNKGAWCTEGGAYWFEGLVRLAWELDDAELKAYATKRLEPLFERMNPNAIAFVYWMDRNDPAQMAEIEKANHGFIVGASGRTSRAMLAYYEATGDERAVRALTWCLDDPRCYFLGNPITLPAAACDTWRYSGDDKLAKAIDNFFATKPYPDKWPAMRYGTPLKTDILALSPRQHTKKWDWRRQHGVLFYESVLSWIKGTCWTGDAQFFANAVSWMDWTERHCRQPHGVIVADESFGHPGPSRGTETCTVAGDILAYTTLAAITGEGRYADHVERSFFNAGPACTSRDFMHHVYFQAPNRTQAIGSFLVGPRGNGGVYKTKHLPLCCTAALARILPGYVQWMWMKPAGGGLAATLYAPNTLETDLDGVAVRIDTKTDYPFNETMEMKVTAEKPVKFPLRLRVPGWCARPRFAVNGEAAAPSVGPDGYAVLDREWKTGDVVSLALPMSPKAETMRDWNDDGKEYCSLSYGPLLFAYGLPEKDENTPAPGARTDWKLDAASAAASAKVVREPMPAKWDWPLASPLRIETKAADGSSLELVPYGCAKLRISMFPTALPQKIRLEWPKGGKRPEVVLDLGPGCDGGYAAFTAANVKGAPVVRASYATHPDGLGEMGDFWYETRATYLGPSIELPILPASVNRYDLFAVTNAGRYAAPLSQGLVRYVRLTLDTPGTAVDIDGFALENRGTYATEPTVGSFSCSDERLNAIWRMSVRTCQLSAIPARKEPLHVVSTLKPAKDVWLGPSYAYLADGAKRDRLVWSGDLWWAQRNMYAAYGYDSPYMPGSLRMLAENHTPEGYVQACPYPESHGPLKAGEWGPFASDEFAAWFVPVVWDHILHSGDRALAKELYPVVSDLVKYLRSHCRADGIFEQRRETSKHASSLDFGSASCYHRAYMNILNWKVYRDAADLAEWLGEKGPADEWRSAAETLAAAVRRVFWDAGKGRFKGAVEADWYDGEANALALAVRFCTADEAAQVRKTIKRHSHGKFQALFVRGLYEFGYPDDAVARIYEHGWDDALDSSWKGPHLTSECMHLHHKGWGDEAHPDTAIAGILSNYILGVEPTEPGFAKYRVNPRPSKGVTWAAGVVPTPWGELHVSWKLKNGKPEVKCREVRNDGR